MWGVIERIRIFPEKGSAGVELAEGRLVEDSGLEGDFHAAAGEERQISLLISGERKWLLEQKERGPKAQGPKVDGPRVDGPKVQGLCLSRFKENICVQKLAPDTLQPGVRLEAGEAVLEITGVTKHCYEECPLYQAGKSCSLAGRNLFAKVLKGGLIHPGDILTIPSQSI